jgi:hypothetical protein
VRLKVAAIVNRLDRVSEFLTENVRAAVLMEQRGANMFYDKLHTYYLQLNKNLTKGQGEVKFIPAFKQVHYNILTF